jgi:hypothetical protein
VKLEENIKGKMKDDPEWIKGISSYYFKCKRNSDEYNKILRELYLNYIREGKRSDDAFKLAKKILDSFEYDVK